VTEWLAYRRMRRGEKELASLPSPSLPLPPKKVSDA